MAPFENMPIDEYPQGDGQSDLVAEVEQLANEVALMRANDADNAPPPVA